MQFRSILVCSAITALLTVGQTDQSFAQDANQPGTAPPPAPVIHLPFDGSLGNSGTFPVPGTPIEPKGDAYQGNVEFSEGQIGQALRLTGDYAIKLPFAMHRGAYRKVTVTAWVYSEPGREREQVKLISNGSFFWLNLYGEGIHLNCGSRCFVRQDNTVSDGIWLFATATMDLDAGTMSLTVNGLPMVSDLDISRAPDDTPALWIGTRRDADATLGGHTRIDDVRVYGSVLSAAQINDLYVQGLTGAAPSETASGGNEAPAGPTGSEEPAAPTVNQPESAPADPVPAPAPTEPDPATPPEGEATGNPDLAPQPGEVVLDPDMARQGPGGEFEREVGPGEPPPTWFVDLDQRYYAEIAGNNDYGETIVFEPDVAFFREDIERSPLSLKYLQLILRQVADQPQFEVRICAANHWFVQFLTREEYDRLRVRSGNYENITGIQVDPNRPANRSDYARSLGYSFDSCAADAERYVKFYSLAWAMGGETMAYADAVRVRVINRPIPGEEEANESIIWAGLRGHHVNERGEKTDPFEEHPSESDNFARNSPYHDNPYEGYDYVEEESRCDDDGLAIGITYHTRRLDSVLQENGQKVDIVTGIQLLCAPIVRGFDPRFPGDKVERIWADALADAGLEDLSE